MPRVLVKFFSLLKDAVGSRAVRVDVEDGCTVRCLLERMAEENPKLAKALAAIDWNVIILIDGRPAGLDDEARGEVTVFPPSAGGSCRCAARVLAPGERIDLDEVVSWLAGASEETGAVALFVGVVRGRNMGERVKVLEYEHDEETAERALARIAEEVAAKHEGVHGVYIAHYTGHRRPGELTLIVAVAGGHRRDVYPALEEAVERVKHEAPIWKTEYRDTGKVYIVGDRVVRAGEIGEEG